MTCPAGGSGVDGIRDVDSGLSTAGRTRRLMSVPLACPAPRHEKRIAVRLSPRPCLWGGRSRMEHRRDRCPVFTIRRASSHSRALRTLPASSAALGRLGLRQRQQRRFYSQRRTVRVRTGGRRSLARRRASGLRRGGVRRDGTAAGTGTGSGAGPGATASWREQGCGRGTAFRPVIRIRGAPPPPPRRATDPRGRPGTRPVPCAAVRGRPTSRTSCAG